MADLTPSAQRLAGRQHGAITTRQLTAAGVGRSTMLRLERSGVLIAEFKSVRRLASAPRTLEQRCAELCLAHSTAFVTGVTAGTLIGLRKMPRHSPITLASPHPLHVEHLGVSVRRSTKVDARDVEHRLDGIAVAHPVRLAFDLAKYLTAHDHRSVVDQLMHEHGVQVEDLARIGLRLYHHARPGSQRFADTIMGVSATPTESDAELRVAEALLRRGVPIETNERWLDLPNGTRARLDLSVSAVRWGVEIDVHPSHLGVVGTSADKRRDRLAKLVGWSIDRVTALDLVDLERTADELAMLFRRRCIEVGAA